MRHRSGLLRRGLPLPWVVAWRYVRGRRSRLLGSTATAALVATTLGVTAMVVAMALMTGYTDSLRRKLIGQQGEVVVTPLGSEAMARTGEALERVRHLAGVERVGVSSYGEGSITSPELPEGVAVMLRGVEPGSDPLVPDAAALAPRDGVPGVLIGEELRRRLEVAVGDVVRLIVLDLEERTPRFRYKSARIADVFTSGFAQFDSGLVVMDRAVLEAARGGGGSTLGEVHLVDPAATERLTAEIEALLGGEFLVSSWLGLNRELFAALELQEAILFLVLGLIVVVSTFNVASTLVILVRERGRDIGVLGALGMRPSQLWWIFSAYGLMLGALGTALGVSIGTVISWLVTELELIRFGPEVAAIYFIDSVPFLVEPADVGAIVAFALVVTLVACSLPALRAATVQPSAALRDE